MMANESEYVDDKLVFLRWDNLWVPFENQSDALLVQLCLYHRPGISSVLLGLMVKMLADPIFDPADPPTRHASEIEAIINREVAYEEQVVRSGDAVNGVCRSSRSQGERNRLIPFLDLLSNQSFHPQDLTIKSCDDIDTRISNHKMHLASQRYTGLATIGLPHVVLECAVECMTDIMCHFFLETRLDATHHRKVEDPITQGLRADLARMCQVHRSWTPVVQRCLRRRVVIRDYSQLQAFSQSPLCGPWVREFAYCNLAYDRVVYDSDSPPARCQGELLASALSRMPNLRFFGCIFISRGMNYESLYNHIEVAFRELARLRHLEGVWFHDSDGDTTFPLDEFCTALPQMENLKCLLTSGEMYHCCSAESSARSHRRSITVPPASLRSLSINVTYIDLSTGKLHIDLLSWLVRPRLGFALQNLFVADLGRRKVSLDDVICALEGSGCLPLLQRLSIGSGQHVRGWSVRRVQRMLLCCSSLKKLYLGIPINARRSKDIRLLKLPGTLESLCVMPAFVYDTENSLVPNMQTLELVDQCLSTLLANNTLPHLRIIQLDASSSEGYREGVRSAGAPLDVPNHLPLTSKMCDEERCELHEGLGIGEIGYIIDVLENR